ncbi:MAB_1171c family putative transporter [Streptomyces sp. NPDC059688]|uniref:MAB_1171c family putative transporter n=1 Tax=Streptomyces sp. NPDC059688 TaxID=3346906 RepID=UPI00369A4F81
MLFIVVYGMLSLITWSAFAVKLKDLSRDWRNRELQLLCLAISTFAAPFFFATPPVYVRLDALLGQRNIATLIIYTCVAVCLTSFLALLVSWSSTQSKIRLRHRLIVGYAVTTIVAMVTFFFLGTVNDTEHPVDFDVHYASTPYITEFLLTYQCLFTVSMIGLILMCWRYSTMVDRPWLRGGLRVITAGAVTGLGYCLPKAVSLAWDVAGDSPLDSMSSVVAPMFASAAAALFAIGFTMPVWGVGMSTTASWISGYLAFQRRYPLWQAITRAFPEIVLVPPPSSRLELARELSFYQNRQVIEILDGEMRLRPHYDTAISELTRKEFAGRRITGIQAEALVEAVQLAAALQAHVVGRELPLRSETDVRESTDGDLAKEATRLVRVAEALLSPVVPAVLARLTATAHDCRTQS